MCAIEPGMIRQPRFVCRLHKCIGLGCSSPVLARGRHFVGGDGVCKCVCVCARVHFLFISTSTKPFAGFCLQCVAPFLLNICVFSVRCAMLFICAASCYVVCSRLFHHRAALLLLSLSLSSAGGGGKKKLFFKMAVTSSVLQTQRART